MKQYHAHPTLSVTVVLLQTRGVAGVSGTEHCSVVNRERWWKSLENSWPFSDIIGFFIRVMLLMGYEDGDIRSMIQLMLLADPRKCLLFQQCRLFKLLHKEINEGANNEAERHKDRMNTWGVRPPTLQSQCTEFTRKQIVYVLLSQL